MLVLTNLKNENSRPITDKMLSKRFHKYVRFGTLREVVFYSLRHTGATAQMQVSGNDIKAVQANMEPQRRICSCRSMSALLRTSAARLHSGRRKNCSPSSICLLLPEMRTLHRSRNHIHELQFSPFFQSPIEAMTILHLCFFDFSTRFPANVRANFRIKRIRRECENIAFPPDLTP